MKTFKFLTLLFSILFFTTIASAQRGGGHGYRGNCGYRGGYSRPVYSHSYYVPRPMVYTSYNYCQTRRIWIDGYWSYNYYGVAVWIPGFWRIYY